MTIRQGKLRLNNTSLHIWEEHVEDSFFDVYKTILSHLRRRGFKVKQDPDTKAHYPSLAKTHHVGLKGEMACKITVSGRHLEIHFFQAHIHRAEYDYDQYTNMPYLMSRMMLIEMAYILEYCTKKYGYTQLNNQALAVNNHHDVIALTKSQVEGVHPTTNPLANFNKSWGHDRFKRDELGWPTQDELGTSHHLKDRDGVILEAGMTRYFRGRDGRCRPGLIYPNMNGRWQIVYGPDRGDTTWLSSHELFSLQVTDTLSREVSHHHKVSILTKKLKACVDAQQFERAIVLRDLLSDLAYTQLALAA